MSIAMMIEEALSDKNESELLKKKSDGLSQLIRGAILSRAKEIAEQSHDQPLLHGKRLEYVVAEWTDEANRLHRITYQTYFGRLISQTYTGERPSGRATSFQTLLRTPLQHLSEHFGPLMS